MVVTANDLKIHGVSLLDTVIQDFSRAIISVRGKRKYAVVPLDEYEEMESDRMDLALAEVEEDIRLGKYYTDTSQFFKEVGIS